jgi:hypothetical protein
VHADDQERNHVCSWHRFQECRSSPGHSNREAVMQISPGLSRRAATLGLSCRKEHNPNGVASLANRPSRSGRNVEPYAATLELKIWRNPGGVAIVWIPLPRVAAKRGNPGLSFVTASRYDRDSGLDQNSFVHDSSPARDHTD